MLENNEFNYSCEHTEDVGYFPLSLHVVSRKTVIHHVKPPLDHTRYNLRCDGFGLEPGLSPNSNGRCKIERNSICVYTKFIPLQRGYI